MSSPDKHHLKQDPHATLSEQEAMAFSPFVLVLQLHAEATQSLFEKVTIEDGEYLYLRGDTADAFYGVMSGNVKSVVLGNDGKEVVVSYALQGDWFGEIGVWRQKPV